MTYPTFTNGQVLPASDLNAIGLWLVKSQTVGTGVSSVTVTGAFSADYDNYRIIYSGGSSTVAGELLITLKNGGTTATNWYYTVDAFTYAGANLQAAGTAQAGTVIGGKDNGWARASFDLLNPFTSGVKIATCGYATGTYAGNANGVNAFSTGSFTDLYLYPSSGTLTGGTIRVYGYRN